MTRLSKPEKQISGKAIGIDLGDKGSFRCWMTARKRSASEQLRAICGWKESSLRNLSPS
jgi:hypothetical protein